MTNNVETHLSKMPVVAIIRGVTPDEVADIGSAIYEAGVGIIEVPLNSPNPFDSIENLSNALGSKCVIGCGTLVNHDDAQRVADAGGTTASVSRGSTSRLPRRPDGTGMKWIMSSQR